MHKGLVVAMAAALLITGCTPASSTSTPSRSAASASPSAPPADFTREGVAKKMVDELLARADTSRALMVEITASTVEVVVNAEPKPVAWAYRGDTVAQVASDLADVGQASFDPDAFNLTDVGALFRAAAGQSGSTQQQTLTIVDHSAGDVLMSVSTVPESRTVFFTGSGTLLETLDFDTLGGISRGIADVTSGRSLIYSLTVISDQGVSAEYPGTTGTIVRRLRSPKVPTITTTRQANTNLTGFNPTRVDAATVWRVVETVRSRGVVPEQGTWSVTVDARTQTPLMYFSFGFTQVVATLGGTILSS